MSHETVDPTGDSIRRLRDEVPSDTPIVMLNLLRFRDHADYPEGSGQPTCTGREAYARYSRVALEKVRSVGGEPVFGGAVGVSVVAPRDEAWDDMLLVRYPSVAAFLRMLAMPDYQEATLHRTAALRDARLIATLESDQF